MKVWDSRAEYSCAPEPPLMLKMGDNETHKAVLWQCLEGVWIALKCYFWFFFVKMANDVLRLPKGFRRHSESQGGHMWLPWCSKHLPDATKAQFQSCLEGAGQFILRVWNPWISKLVDTEPAGKEAWLVHRCFKGFCNAENTQGRGIKESSRSFPQPPTHSPSIPWCKTVLQWQNFWYFGTSSVAVLKTNMRMNQMGLLGFLRKQNTNKNHTELFQSARN